MHFIGEVVKREMEFLYYQDLLTKTYGHSGVVQQLLSKKQSASAGFEKAPCIAEASLLRTLVFVSMLESLKSNAILFKLNILNIWENRERLQQGTQYRHAQNSFPCLPCMPQKIFTSMVAKTGTIMLAKDSYYPANKQTFSLFAHCSQEPWIKYSSQATVQNGNFCEILLDSLRRDRLLCPKVTLGLCWSCIKRMAADRLASLPCIFLWHFLELILGSGDSQALRKLFCSLLALSPVEKINKSLCFQGRASKTDS